MRHYPKWVMNHRPSFILRLDRYFLEREHRSFVKMVSDLNPKRIMEIGLWKGYGTERILKALDGNHRDVEYYGFDIVPAALEYSQTVLERMRIKKYHLFLGDTKTTLPGLVDSLPKMDFIYIDGDHDYKTAISDWENSKKLIHDGSVVIFDDAHWGDVKKVVSEIKGFDVQFLKSTRFYLTHLPQHTVKAVVKI